MFSCLFALPLALLITATKAADSSTSSQGLVIDTSSFTTATSDASSSSLSYIHGSISSTSYSIVGNTLVVSYTTNSNFDIVAASAATETKKNAANAADLQNLAAIAGGFIAGVLIL